VPFVVGRCAFVPAGIAGRPLLTGCNLVPLLAEPVVTCAPAALCAGLCRAQRSCGNGTSQLASEAFKIHDRVLRQYMTRTFTVPGCQQRGMPSWWHSMSRLMP